MAYDAGLVERVADMLAQIGERGVRQKNVFGGRGFLAGKSTFVIVWEDGLLVKTPAESTRRSSSGPESSRSRRAARPPWARGSWSPPTPSPTTRTSPSG